MRNEEMERCCDQYLLSYKHFVVQIIALQNVLQKANFKVVFGTRLRANDDCEVAETYLK